MRSFEIMLQQQGRRSQSTLVGIRTSARFEVSAFGSAPITYQWLKDGAPVPEDGNISGARSSRLDLSNVQMTDTGGYAVTLNNPLGSSTSMVATLTVVLPPTIRLVSTSSPGIPSLFATLTSTWWDKRRPRRQRSNFKFSKCEVRTVRMANGDAAFTLRNLEFAIRHFLSGFLWPAEARWRPRVRSTPR